MRVFEEKSKERKNVNDGHMFAAEVFVHEILQQEAQNFLPRDVHFSTTDGATRR